MPTTAQPQREVRTRVHPLPSSLEDRRPAADPDSRYRWDVAGRMPRRDHRRRLAGALALAVGDAVCAAAALAAALLVVSGGALPSGRWLILLPTAVLLTWGGQAIAGTYWGERARRRLLAAGLGAGLSVATAAALGVLHPQFQLPAGGYLVLAVLLPGLVAGLRRAVKVALGRCHAKGLLRRPALLIAEEEEARRVEEWLREHGHEWVRIAGRVSPRRQWNRRDSLPFPELGARIEETDAHTVLVAGDVPERALRPILYQCLLHGAEVRILGAPPAGVPAGTDPERREMWRPELGIRNPRSVDVAAKRALDLGLSAAALVLLSPLYAAVALAIKLDSSGPVHFRQERLGLGGRRFTLLKFRSMRTGAEELLRTDLELYRKYMEHDYKLSSEADPRVTRVGRFLRRTSLDELPQLLNVLRGEMSLVGPRPVVPPEIREYGPHTPTFLAMKPGMTGHWQVSGRNAVGYPERARRELHYVENWSLWRDFEILLLTVPAVLRDV